MKKFHEIELEMLREMVKNQNQMANTLTKKCEMNDEQMKEMHRMLIEAS